ncbi:MAG: thioredoxin family protein [Planctomycetales bacterium]|nr:thioredoxin family protein [Planctomycetales bacterium]
MIVRLLTFMVGLTLLAPVSLAAETTAKPVSAFKHATIDAAWKASQKSKRPLLIFVCSDNCFYCVKMLKETYSHQQIAMALRATSESVAVKNDDVPELVKQFKINAYPTTLVVSPEGKELARIKGFLPPEKFVAKLFRPADERTAQAKAPRPEATR